MVWTSQIKRYEDLELRIRYRPPSTSTSAITFASFPTPGTTFRTILSNFLRRSGIPSPTLFSDAQSHFSPLVDLSKIDDPSFRPRMFCWAATGSPSLTTELGNIMVRGSVLFHLYNLFDF